MGSEREASEDSAEESADETELSKAKDKNESNRPVPLLASIMRERD